MHGPQPQSVVLAHGCFDLLHLGHIRHLREAREQGERLVVSVTDDRFVRKGPGRPHFTTEQRVEALQALDCVDEVVVSESPDAVDVINRIRPAVYVKGIDYGGKEDAALDRELEAVKAWGGRFHVTSAEKWSSSRLLNGERFSDGVMEYLASARIRGFWDRIEGAFARADQLRIAFVGETIVDEYRYVASLGKPSKEFVLATVETGCERFDGGVKAAAKHAEWAHARVVTPARSVTKTRFVDADFTRKLFEVYSGRSIDLTGSDRAGFQRDLIEAARDCDAVVLFDFGHGLMEAPERHFAESARFFAVNAQTNAGNYGFNPVTKYQHADLVCVDDPEARLATGMRTEPIDAVIQSGLAARINSRRFAVTNGRHGSVAFDRAGVGERMAKIPALATHGHDTMGAGDAFLAVAGPLVAAGLDVEAAAFAGNVAGAIKVSIVGHRRHVGRQELLHTIEALLK